MACIDRLQISGIRSFDPNPSNKQEIHFRKPLTIILGKNGAGKTTIIEALLNVCTGKMPPGAAGPEKVSFIYDPKVAGESNVKGQIRLVFTSRNGNGMQVIRSYQVSQSRAKTTFTSLDGTISVKNPETDKIESASCRCDDLNTLVPEHLGVSTAVLEHVVFCHQEDCNWPLGAPAEVKKKFDDIFASTRYVAALDKLRDRAKFYRAEQKEKEAMLLCYRECRDQARQLQADIDSKEEAVRLTKLRNRETEPRLQQLRNALDALDGISHNVESLMRDAAMLTGKIDEKQSNLRRLKIAAPTETLPQLRDMLNDFEAQTQRTQQELHNKQGRADACEAAARKALVESSEAMSRLHVASAQDEEQQRKLAALRQALATIAPDIVPSLNGAIDESVIARFEERLRGAAVATQRAVNEELGAYRQKTTELGQRREHVLRSLDADAKERELKEQQLRSLQQRAAAVLQGQPQVTAEDVRRMQADVHSAEARVQAARDARERGDHRRAVDALQRELVEKNARVAELRRELGERRVHGVDATRLDDVRSQLQRRTELVRAAVVDRIAPALEGFGRRPAAPTLATVTAACDQLRHHAAQALAATREQHRAAEYAVRSAAEQLAVRSDELRVAERDAREKRSVCRAALGGDDAIVRFSDLLSECDERHLRKCRDSSSIEALAQCYESFVAAATKDQMCVVCRRGLPGAELADFIRLNNERQAATPQQLQRARDDAATAAAELQRLKGLEPVVRDLLALEARVPTLAAQIATLTEAHESAKALLGQVLIALGELEAQDRRATAIADDIRAAAAASNEAEALQREAAVLEARLGQQRPAASGARFSGFSMDDLQQQHETLMGDLQQLSERLAGLQQSATPHGDVELERTLVAKRHELLRAEADLERRVRDEAALESLRAEATEVAQRSGEIDARRDELQRGLAEVDAALTGLHAAHDTRLREAQEQHRAADDRLRQFAHSADAARAALNAGSGAKLQAAREAAKAAERAAQQATAEAAALRRDIEEGRRGVGEQQRHRDALRLRKDYAELQEEIAGDARTLQNCQESLAKLQGARIKDFEELLGPQAASEPPSKLRETIRAKAAELERVRAQNDGKKETLLADVAALKGQLAKDKYRDVAQRYTATFIKVQTLELAVQDIDKYYRALEKAVASYHQEKIAQINRIIADLWRRTYRGSDIDTVEICSEADGTAAGADSRRTFKYRVVMRRGDAALDMRGRCSAGQKVLASVVIRMALSEAFCCDCGILALDEPTTNLDDDNARALAEALKDLIETRSSAKNFQLVVITHDEQFVRVLGARQRDSVYFVTKNREGAFSVINERHYDELFV